MPDARGERPGGGIAGDGWYNGAGSLAYRSALRRAIYRAGLVWRRAVAKRAGRAKPLVPVAHAALVPLSQPAPQQAASVPVSAPTKQKVQASVEEESPQEEDYLPALRYSAHIYASSEDKRTIVINGQSWQEGQSPLPNLVIEQIQQDLTVFSFKGNTFTLAALDDWPGGIIADSPQGQ